MGDLRIDARVVIPAADLSWSAARSSGPGGQNVNRVASKVDLRFDLDGTVALTPPVKERLRRLAATRLDRDGRLVITSPLCRDPRRYLDVDCGMRSDVLSRALTPCFQAQYGGWARDAVFATGLRLPGVAWLMKRSLAESPVREATASARANEESQA